MDVEGGGDGSEMCGHFWACGQCDRTWSGSELYSAVRFASSGYVRFMYHLLRSVACADRQLTGDKELEVVAGCASASLYKRKAKPTQTTSTGIIDTLLQKTGLSSAAPGDDAPSAESSSCGIGEWDPVFLGRADYLDNGLERDWSFRDVVFVDGEVITVCFPSDHPVSHTPADT